MKRKNLYMLVVLFSLSIGFSASAQDARYLVKIEQPKVSLIQLEEDANSQTAPTFLVAENEQELAYIMENYNYEYIEPDKEVVLFNCQDEPLYNSQYAMHLIHAEYAWKIGCYGNDVKIAVIDSGIAPHEDITENVLPGYNFLWEKESQKLDVSDELGHGTFASGIIAAEINTIGIAGLANMAKVVPIKCFGKTTTYVSQIVSAIKASVDTYDCNIINMSFGTADAQALEDIINYAASKGAIMVAAVGNEGTNEMKYPAGYENVIGVGSVNRDKVKAEKSQMNESVFVTAPGEDIVSLAVGGGYRTDSGTSFAAPVVSSMAAIARNINPEISAAEFKTALRDSADDLGNPGYDTNYGFGLVNIERFVGKLLESKDVYVSEIDNRNDKATVTVYNNSENELNAVSYFADYNGMKMNNCIIAPLKVPSGETKSVTFDNEFENIKHFIWDKKLNSINKYKQLKGE